MRTFDFSPDTLGQIFGKSGPGLELKYRELCEAIGGGVVLEGRARESLILHVLETIDNDTQRVDNPERAVVWERGWREALEEYRKTGASSSLVPRFVRPCRPVRYRGEYALPANPWFERDWVALLRAWLADTYFVDCDCLYEYGAGTGWNLLAIQERHPRLVCKGFDFVDSAVELINEVGRTTGRPITGERFDFFAPGKAQGVDRCGVLTMGALEQTAGVVQPFVDFLLAWEHKPSFVVHVEPVPELIPGDALFDSLALRFLRQRGYSTGLLPYLQGLARQGRIDILRATRTGIGSLYMEGYNVVAWRPR